MSRRNNTGDRDAPADELEMREAVATEKRFWLRISRFCNNRCIFCLDSDLQDGEIEEHDGLVAQIRAARAKGAERLILSGGEASIHPRFPDLVAEAARAGYSWIQTISNGRMFAYPDFTRRVVSAGLREVTVSMHGPDAALHDRLTGIPGAFDQAVAGIKNLTAAGCLVTVDVVINRLNHARLTAIMRACHRMGVREFDLLYITPFGRAWHVHRDDLYGEVIAAGRPDPGFARDLAASIRAALLLGDRLECTMWTNRVPPPLLEGMERFMQDPHKLLDEVRGRRVLFAEVLAGGEMACRDDGRCRMCFVHDLCRTLHADVAAARAISFESAIARAGAVDPAFLARLAAAPGGVSRLVVEIAGPGDLDDAAALVKAARPRRLEVSLGGGFARLDPRAVSALRDLGARAYRSAVPAVLKALARTGLAPCAVLTKAFAAALDRDPALVDALRRANAGAFAPSYDSLADETKQGLTITAAAEAARRFDALAGGLPACVGGAPATDLGPRLDAVRLGGDLAPTIDLDAFAADFLARRLQTKSLRCEGCVEDPRCPGIHLTHARAAGYAALTPFPPAQGRPLSLRAKKPGHALFVQCDSRDLVYSHLLGESLKVEAARAGVALDVIATAFPSAVKAEVGAFVSQAPAGGTEHRVDDRERAIATLARLYEPKRWTNVVFNGFNGTFWGILALCRTRGWRPRLVLYDGHAGAGMDEWAPFFPSATAAFGAARDAGLRIVAPFDAAVLAEVYGATGLDRGRIRPVRQWIDPVFFARATRKRRRVVLAPGSTARDWATLFRACPHLSAPLETAGGAIAGAPRGVVEHPRATLDAYRGLIAGATVAVFPIGHANAAITSALIAMAVGTPVVIGRSRFLGDYLREGETCLSYEPGDAGDLAAKANLLLDSPKKAAALAKTARTFVERRLGPGTLFKALFLGRSAPP